MRSSPHFAAVALSLLVFSQASQASEADWPTVDLAFDTINGEKALETVKYLDQFVRWPGNAGFDASIDHIAARLELSGFLPETEAPPGSRLTYRVESYPMDQPAWEPLEAWLTIVGDDEPILQFAANRNMLARRSHATPRDGIVAKLVYVGGGTVAELDAAEVHGNVVLVDGEIDNVFEGAVIERGALGVLAYSLPAYLKPQVNRHSVQFRGIPADAGEHESWAISLSTDARERLGNALTAGQDIIRVNTQVQWTSNAVERTVVANITGSQYADERFVFSAHVQEPGANDNASGVGTLLEVARVAGILLKNGGFDPGRSITFLWGDEIRSTARYVNQNIARAAGIRWGMSLDMVGEDTEKTGGTFLIEKMPDPSAIWTRGNDQHTEWGGDVLKKEDLTPHYFNDLVFTFAELQAERGGSIVKTNPFEGGSDHVPFLRADIPGILLWHFTDQFYHTDRDRLEMVSSNEMRIVGATALTTAMALTTANDQSAQIFVQWVRNEAFRRIAVETRLGIEAIETGGPLNRELDILATWADWYDQALESMNDIEVGGSTALTVEAIELARGELREESEDSLQKLKEVSLQQSIP